MNRAFFLDYLTQWGFKVSPFQKESCSMFCPGNQWVAALQKLLLFSCQILVQNLHNIAGIFSDISGR